MRVRRIYLYGAPGTGKSTLAEELGDRLRLPVHGLDEVALATRADHEPEIEARRAWVAILAAQSRWIAEGAFLEWTDALLDRADVIVWLDDLPWPVVASRILRRFVRLAWAEFREQKGVHKTARVNDYARNLRDLVEAVRNTRRYGSCAVGTGDRDGVYCRPAATAYLAPYEAKLVHCHTRGQRALLARRLTGSGPGDMTPPGAAR